MKRLSGVVLLVTGSVIAILRLGGLLVPYSLPPLLSAGLSGVLIFLGLVLIGLEMKTRKTSQTGRMSI